MTPARTIRFAERISDLPPYLFAELDKLRDAKRAEGVDVISLGIGDPDLPTPEPVIAALERAARDPANHRYPEYYGLDELRDAIAAWYRRRFKVELDPSSEIVPLIGSKEGIAHLPLALVDPGDPVLITDPGYPVYAIGTMLAGGHAHYLPLRAESGWLPDLAAIPADVLARAQLLWLCYPSNPTAAVAPYSFFEESVAFAREHGLLIAQDAAYSEVTFDGYRCRSILEVPGARDVVMEFHSLSKTYNMTGWRIGWVAGNASVVEALGRVKTNVDSGVFQAVQWAGIAALELPQTWIDERNAHLQRRRDLVLEALHLVGLAPETPRASLYVWSPVPDGRSSIEYARWLIDEIGVIVTPGVGFGPSGEGYFRISLTTPDTRLEEALDRITTLER
jgi:LL-diaminopimelate aminotransferase